MHMLDAYEHLVTIGVTEWIDVVLLFLSLHVGG